MNTITVGPQNERGDMQDINIVDASNWGTHAEENTNNNTTLLYIAVEYVEDTRSNVTTQSEVYPDYDPHVSPLDPNMSSVARYSPVYNEPTNEYSPVVIHQLISQDSTVQHGQFVDNLGTSSLGNISTVLCNREVNNEFLQMVNDNGNMNTPTNDDNLQIAPEREQQVELLITDEATGISYSVNAQELLVESCLQEDQQLLEALAPNPILESDLLTLDENTLKTELNDDIDMPPNVPASNENAVDNYINSISENCLTKPLQSDSSFKMETRQAKRNELVVDEPSLSCVYSITDKPILSRAKATLPEAHLIISKIDEEYAIFAKRCIPKRAQFGPLEGVLSANVDTDSLKNDKMLHFLIESEGVSYKIDVSDENSSNWMGFVRKANTFEEQNVIITQEKNGIFFTTTSNILPKQELKVGYSTVYAQCHNLPVLQPHEELTWPCYECPFKFESSEDLQKHLNIHDDDRDENVKPRKKVMKTKKRLFKKYQSDAIECNICEEVFLQYNYCYLKLHLVQKHGFMKGIVEENFTVIMHYKCDYCTAIFKSEAVLKIHNLEHDPDSSDVQRNHVCPSCQRKFPTQRQLVMHVMIHVITKKVTLPEKVKCPICSKLFSERERLQRHMLVHGSDEAKPLQCKTCHKRFLNNSALACHIKTHYNGKKCFECPICNDRFDNVIKFKLHVPSHSQNNIFTCPHCKKAFKKYSIIRKHIRAFHCERTHECQYCTKMFPTVDKLRMHLLRHSDHREFLCADCGKQFKRKDKLKEHCKRIHTEERENTVPKTSMQKKIKKFRPKVEPTDFHRFIYKCHACLVGFKRRGMLVNHLAKRHPEIPPDSVPELNLPILQTTRDYYCQYCDKIYKSSSKRKAHILKNHPGAALPMSNRKRGSLQEVSGLPNPTFSQTVGSITTSPQSCKWCHKQYASKAKLLQHQRKKHTDQAPNDMSLDSDLHNNMDDGKVGMKVDAVSEFDKVVEKIMNNELDDYNLEEDSQYCHLSINENENFIEATELENPNSHLYRLLTTNNGMMPPR